MSDKSCGSDDKPLPLMVVTDLDGTLLDHDDYNCEAVEPVLAQLAALGVPVVANTSKTRAEWEVLRDRLGIDAPYVVENGSAVRLSEDECVVLGVERAVILSHLAEVRGEYHFEGFADWTVEQVIDATGLPRADAELAMAREYSEPLIWRDDESRKQNFIAEMERRGLMVLQGGRFTHVLGATDKGRAIEVLREQLGELCIVALGDSQNDVAMLRAADVPILIKNPKNGLAMEQALAGLEGLRISRKPGPEGWAEEMQHLLAQRAERDFK